MKILKDNTNLVYILGAGLVIVALVLAFGARSSVNITGSGQIQKDTITVSGQAEMTVEPDEAELYVRIETLKVTAQEAKDENSRISADVESALRKAGVGDDEMETSSYNIYPDYEYNSITRKSELVGYRVRNVLKVTTNDMDNIGELIDAAVDAGANGFDNIYFGLSDEKQKEVNAAVLLKASDEAKAKANSLVRNLGAKLGKLSSISESNYYYAPYRYDGDVVFEAAMGEAPKAAVSISPQDVTVSARVTVAYEILQ